ncbi:hypothetical protein HYV85_00925 [Candidatus Woesearchaeota archaeon]|nr:hypothetical protein [Candidatus Woesearchaeota archaeon]
MGGSLVARMEARLAKEKSVLEHEDIGYEEDAVSIPQKESAGTHLELLVHRRYSLPERPDIEIERTVWAYREKRG